MAIALGFVDHLGLGSLGPVCPLLCRNLPETSLDRKVRLEMIVHISFAHLTASAPSDLQIIQGSFHKLRLHLGVGRWS